MGDYSHIFVEAEREVGACSTLDALESLRVKYLGRRGSLSELYSKIPTLSVEERKNFGSSINTLKKRIEELISAKETAIKSKVSVREGGDTIDVTLPGKKPLLGRLHPLTKVETEICAIFGSLGFKIFEGPEVETEYNNFEALNIPLDHPSRDAFDTFYITPSKDSSAPQLLRSHTSPAQIRAMKAYPPPLAILMPGRVYRPDAVDASHSFMFHQVEGIAIDEKIRFSDLKGVLITFAREMFGPSTKLRFRPSFFPFTEPSAEVDISCFLCQGAGCPVCKKTGWLEILGCGMIHPHVLKAGGCDARRFRGFAFGMGVERIAMLKFGITDIRLFFENDIRCLEQF